ncbi:hypothetical protein [Microlunatus antarcticus]|uniref:Uncharacterized protein n=1 Tax=Microlunatus antarcticus TaxID=53388 RepID=A0A7W5JRN3_9ACTN|nr:hypothetical protein [Microlunatus antarcticus]MBB3325077.1 hypothetical protein [Microlunatus antarcticus]
MADLTFEVLLDEVGPVPTTGTVRADGSDVTVDFSRTPSLAGSGTRPLVRPFAQALEDNGLTVHLTGPSGPLLHAGHGVRAPWWQVPATGSRFIRVDVPLAVRSLRGPRLFEVALPPLVVQPGMALTRSRRERLLVIARQLVRRVTRRRR